MPGTVILVSHDRDFLDRTVDAVLVAEEDGRWIEYAGGYSDMVAQRGAGLSARAVEKTPRVRAAKEPPASAPAPGRRKLSFNEQHDLRTLPRRMEGIAAQIAQHEKTLADPTLYARDQARFERTSAALAALQAELAAAEERWLALEILREELEA